MPAPPKNTASLPWLPRSATRSSQTASRLTKVVVWMSHRQNARTAGFPGVLAGDHPIKPWFLSLPRRSSHLSSSGVNHRDDSGQLAEDAGRPASVVDNNVRPSATRQARPSLARLKVKSIGPGHQRRTESTPKLRERNQHEPVAPDCCPMLAGSPAAANRPLHSNRRPHPGWTGRPSCRGTTSR